MKRYIYSLQTFCWNNPEELVGGITIGFIGISLLVGIWSAIKFTSSNVWPILFIVAAFIFFIALIFNIEFSGEYIFKPNAGYILYDNKCISQSEYMSDSDKTHKDYSDENFYVIIKRKFCYTYYYQNGKIDYDVTTHFLSSHKFIRVGYDKEVKNMKFYDEELENIICKL